MSWQPISLADLHSRIDEGVRQMTPSQLRLWRMVATPPEKWNLHPWGDAGGGFWAVAVIGRIVIWFNDIEDGFNKSAYIETGAIGEYFCNQDELHWSIGRLLGEQEGGHDPGQGVGPPQEIV